MLVGIDYKCRMMTKYKCDRCNARLTVETRKAIYVLENKGSPKKKWDLCLKCYASLKRGIEKGKE